MYLFQGLHGTSSYAFQNPFLVTFWKNGSQYFIIQQIYQDIKIEQLFQIHKNKQNSFA